ncbi:MAG: NADPH-dependent FMN reductase [Novibacillus thermophilus]|jgi:FMN reductase|uniref:FMN reductase (NADPH) n=1 Tax=Novibacillus thermophilus TaxID=1471761 RepID=A0A1U9K8L6_9BACL|nr:NADPH-dependent FMN reductase [Novibacillus thermophilus]AQS56395.1 FMN reductase (NADPH) [Novibacillus thermophilus]
MSDVITISGSPSEHSRSECVLKFLCSLIEQEGLSTIQISVRNLKPEDLVYARYDSPSIEDIALSIKNAKGLIVGSPVYKASYSGVLKALFDLLPQDILKHKPTLPIMVGGSLAHLLAVDFALKPLLTALKAQNLQGVYLLDQQIDRENETNPIVNQEVLQRVKKELYSFIRTVKEQKALVV